MNKMRIAIACSSLCFSRGGSERAATVLAAEMARRGHAVLLLSCKYGQDCEPCYGLPAGVRHIAIDPHGRHADIRRLREFLIADETDILLSLQSDSSHLLWCMACMGSGIPFICSERADPLVFTESMGWNRSGRHALLAGADFIHELLPAYVDSIPERLRERAVVIPNAAPQNVPLADAIGGQRKKLLFLARLCAQKQPLLLLDSFKRLANSHPDWDLDIWGHGPHEKKLAKSIVKEGLSGRVFLRGMCTDSSKAFSEAQIYCLPSWFEGFPNTILEAMAAGLPVVGFASCTGVAGVVRDGETGLLAREDTAAGLADTLGRLMRYAQLRKSLGDKGRNACAAYSHKKIFDQWESLFHKAAERKGKTVMDTFYAEPFASKATLSASARREWLYRNFGEAMPYSFAWWCERTGNVWRSFMTSSKHKFRSLRNNNS